MTAACVDVTPDDEQLRAAQLSDEIVGYEQWPVIAEDHTRRVYASDNIYVLEDDSLGDSHVAVRRFDNELLWVTYADDGELLDVELTQLPATQWRAVETKQHSSGDGNVECSACHATWSAL